MKIKSIKSIGIKKVRNLTVHKNHTFINGGGIVTHNCDRASGNLQDALKSTIEQFSKSCSFIFISNHKNKIIPPLQSRLQCIEFKFTIEESKLMKKDFFKSCINILKKENVKFKPDVVAHIVNNMFPDMRSILNELQKLSQQDSLCDINIVKNISTDSNSFFNILRSHNFKELQKYVAQLPGDPQGFYSNLYDVIIKYVEPNSLPDFIILLGKYSYESGFVVDSRVNITAFAAEAMLSCKFNEI